MNLFFSVWVGLFKSSALLLGICFWHFVLFRGSSHVRQSGRGSSLGKARPASRLVEHKASLHHPAPLHSLCYSVGDFHCDWIEARSSPWSVLTNWLLKLSVFDVKWLAVLISTHWAIIQSRQRKYVCNAGCWLKAMTPKCRVARLEHNHPFQLFQHLNFEKGG